MTVTAHSSGQVKAAIEAVGTAAAAAKEAVDIASTETLETYATSLADLATDIRETARKRLAELGADVNKVTNALVQPMNDAEAAEGLGFVNVEGAKLWQDNLDGSGAELIKAKAALVRADTAAEKVAKWADRMKGYYANAHKQLVVLGAFIEATKQVSSSELAHLKEMGTLPAARARMALVDVNKSLLERHGAYREQYEAFISAWRTLIEKTKKNDPPSYATVKEKLVPLGEAIAAAHLAGTHYFIALLEREND